MEKRIKIFYAEDTEGLEAELNHFLETTEGKLVETDFKSNAAYDPETHEITMILFALVTYIPEKD